MAALEWRIGPPCPDPFAAIAGELTLYQVHFASSKALMTAELKGDLSQVVEKAVSLANENLRDDISRLLFLWDSVYSVFTVVYTDEKMEHDARQVTKCGFTAIDEHFQRGEFLHPRQFAERNKFGRIVCATLEDLAAAGYLNALPPAIDAYFSDHDRASCGSSSIPVHRIPMGP